MKDSVLRWPLFGHRQGLGPDPGPLSCESGQNSWVAVGNVPAIVVQTPWRSPRNAVDAGHNSCLESKPKQLAAPTAICFPHFRGNSSMEQHSHSWALIASLKAKPKTEKR